MNFNKYKEKALALLLFPWAYSRCTKRYDIGASHAFSLTSNLKNSQHTGTVFSQSLFNHSSGAPSQKFGIFSKTSPI